ncbi:MAG: glutamate--tRNA ligase [Lentisphaerae bacterium]|jgi:glutamyl-tRNA synthetase|nr:glutamate--tRNA ligase [Lentisphaerota bacterium]
MSVRVRFAPSPTGNVHIGNIRAAIFNWLFARHEGGKFLLRVEDTDLERSTPEAIETLLECMDWLKLDYDEPAVYQSKNTQRHLEVADELEKKGFAYRDSRGGEGECVVFRMPAEGELEFDDLVKGRMRKKAKDLQDFVIVRSDGSPVFHLANVVDDIDMRITHVMRGDDHVENTFKHLELFRAIGSKAPEYVHLPMIVNNQGKPYSKRDGAAFVGEFREQGFLPDALFNFLVLLGWAPGDDREIMTRDELIEAFTLDRCKTSAARFDIKKLTWMNGEYIANQPREEFKKEFLARMARAGLPATPLFADLDSVLDPVQPRTKTYSDIPSNCIYLFTDDFPFDEKAVNRRLKKEGVRELLLEMAEKFETMPDFTEEALELIIKEKGESLGGMGAVVHPVRVAVSGVAEGPGLFELLVLAGRERVCARCRKAAEMAD